MANKRIDPKDQKYGQIVEIENKKYIYVHNEDRLKADCSLCAFGGKCANLAEKYPELDVCLIQDCGYFKELKKHVFDPKNCQKQIKDQFSIGGITFTLTSHHAFEWSIAKTENGKITISVYQDRNAAKKEFERKKRLKRKLQSLF